MELERKYTLDDFPQGDGPEPARQKATVAQEQPVVPIGLGALPPP